MRTSIRRHRIISAIQSLPTHTRTLVKANVWGVTDSGFASVSNFATTVLLARFLGPSAFGSFSLAYLMILVGNGLISGLTSQPHMVLSAHREGKDYRQYTSSTAVGQLMLLALLSVVGLAAASVSFRAGWSLAPLILATVPALIAFRIQDSVLYLLYTEGRPKAALANDCVNYGSQVLGLVALAAFGRLTGPSALLVIGGSSAFGVGLAVWQLRTSIEPAIDVAHLKENWTFGKWLAGAQVAQWFAVPSYSYLAGVLRGTAAAGSMRVAQVLFGPLNVLIMFLSTVLPIRFARTLAASGSLSLRGRVRTVYALSAPLFGAYCLGIAVFAGQLLNLVYGPRYASAVGVVRLMAIYYFLYYSAQIVTAELKARRATQITFRGALYGGLTALVVGWFLVQTFGAEGAVIGMTISVAEFNLVLWTASGRLDSDKTPRQDAISTGADSAVRLPVAS